MLYLDASFFLFALLDNTSKGQRARDIHRGIAKGKEQAAASPLAIEEIMRVLVRADKRHLIRTAVEDIYSTPNLDILPIPPVIPLISLGIMEQYDLKPRDAFHIALMKESRLTKIVTDDKDFDKVEWLKRIRLSD